MLSLLRPSLSVDDKHTVCTGLLAGLARKLIFLLSLVPILFIIVYLLSPEYLSSVFAHLTEQDVSPAQSVTIIIWLVVKFTRILVSCNLQDHYCLVRRAQNKAAN